MCRMYQRKYFNTNRSAVWHKEFSRDENITTNVQPIPYWMSCAHPTTVQRTSSSCSCSRSMLYKIENPYRFSMPISSIYYVVKVLFKQIINFPGWLLLLLLFFFPCFFAASILLHVCGLFVRSHQPQTYDRRKLIAVRLEKFCGVWIYSTIQPHKQKAHKAQVVTTMNI